MAGHSKWSNIQHRKGAQDRKRAKIFTKLIREVTSAARVGGKNPKDNPRLRLAILKANAANVNKDSLQKAIARGAGELPGAVYQEIVYEGYGPGGSALLVEVETDNHARSLPEIRALFNKNGGKMASENSVAYLFQQRGYICFDDLSHKDSIFELAIEQGADDFTLTDDNIIEVTTLFENHYQVSKAFNAKGFKSIDEGLYRYTEVKINLSQPDKDKNLELIDILNNNDDVQEVYTNIKF